MDKLREPEALGAPFGSGKNSLLERIRAVNSEVRALRKELDKPSSYYGIPYAQMMEYHAIISAAKASKFIEGWLAHLIGGKKIETALVEEQFKQNDVGDIWTGDSLKIGTNNIEVKCIMRPDSGTIGGEQFRFYDPVPWYMLFKGWDHERYDMFLLTKEQLVEEIILRAQSGKSAFRSSQGSGVINKLTPEQKIQRIHDNVAGRYADKLGWTFNADTEPDIYNRFVEKYRVEPNQVKALINLPG